MSFAALQRFRAFLAELGIARSAQDREERALEQARRLDADEVGRRADDRASNRPDARRRP